MSGADFSPSNYWAEFRRGNQETHTEIENVYKGFKGQASPTSRAYSDADPGLVCPAAAAADDFLFLKNIEPKGYNVVTDTLRPR